MPRKTKRVSQSTEALKLARLKELFPLRFEGFSEQSEWRQLTINKICVQKRTACEKNGPMVKKKIRKFTKNKQIPSKRAAISTPKVVLRAKAVGAAEYVIEKENVLRNEQAEEVASKLKIVSGKHYEDF